MAGNLDGLRVNLTTRLQFQFADKDDKGYTPLHWAAWGGHLKCVAWLKNRKDVDESETNFCETPLDIAERNKHSDVVALLKYGIKPREEKVEEPKVEDATEDSTETITAQVEEIDSDDDYMSESAMDRKRKEGDEEYRDRMWHLYALATKKKEEVGVWFESIGGVQPPDENLDAERAVRAKTIKTMEKVVSDIELELKAAQLRFDVLKEGFVECTDRKMRMHERIDGGLQSDSEFDVDSPSP
eukprot:m.4579 g.4579  ORF g.4579 m.4579 type:complete len:242 (+) comp3467_c0_seq1:203-928(+)